MAWFKQPDDVLYLRAPGKYLNDPANWPIQVLAKTAFWPNNPDLLPSTTHYLFTQGFSVILNLPEDVVPGYEGMIQPSGFLVPTKTKGKLQLYNMQVANPAETEVNIASSDVIRLLDTLILLIIIEI